jgi:hypothetical protein
VTFNKRERATVEPGTTVALGAHVRPRTRGPVKVLVERFDPVAGWQFFHSYRRRTASNGDATIPFRPPAVGRYRASVSFEGTPTDSPSGSGYAFLKVQRPIEG